MDSDGGCTTTYLIPPNCHLNMAKMIILGMYILPQFKKSFKEDHTNENTTSFSGDSYCIFIELKPFIEKESPNSV